ncbi:hypothetical protein STEG23_018517, partial [Scotinomys teguina]
FKLTCKAMGSMLSLHTCHYPAPLSLLTLLPCHSPIIQGDAQRTSNEDEKDSIPLFSWFCIDKVHPQI